LYLYQKLLRLRILIFTGSFEGFGGRGVVTARHEIVSKCGGLPLAARTLDALLCSNTNAQEWEEIRNNSMRDLPNVEVLPAL